MIRSKLARLTLATACTVGAISVIAIAEPAKETKPAGQPEMQLPKGWTPEDMQACIMAGTPGKMQEHLAKSAGVWQGKNTMWMAPDSPPMTTTSTSTITPIMDGRYVKCEMAGDMPGMGPYNGFAIYGFDNVSQKFVSTWIDNMGTGIANGTGELSSDGKVMTWNYSFNCPIAKKAVVLREVETTIDANNKKLEMFSPDPKTGKEYKMMEIVMTRQPTATGSAAVPTGR